MTVESSRATPLTRARLATVVGAIFWSTGGLWIKLLPQGALAIVAYRSAWAAALLGPLYRRQLCHFNRQAAINVAVYMGLLLSFVSATKLTTAANAIFLQYTGVAYVLVGEPLLLKTPLRRLDAATVIVCFGGMALFFWDGLAVHASGLAGLSLATLSGVLLAALLLGQRRNPPRYHLAAIFWGNIGLVLLCAPAAWQAGPPTLAQHAMLAFLGLVQIGLGYALFSYGLARIPALEASLYAMLEPVLNPLWVLIGYGERPSAKALLGGGIVVAALVLRTLALGLRTRPRS